MRLSARGAMQTRQDSKHVEPFSKQWKSGDNATVYYPIYVADDGEIDILIADCWGHNIDPKETGLKRIFAPTNSEIIDGVPKKADLLYQFSKLAPLFLLGAKEKDIAEKTARKMDQSQLKSTLEKIEEKYAEKSPVVGKLRYVISTECIYVPLNDKREPILDKIKLVSQDLSDTRINSLYAIIGNAQYVKHGDRGYLEVTYAFGTKNDRKEDGKVSPVGVSQGFELETLFPSIWSAIQGVVASLPESSDTIRKRNKSMRPIEESEIKKAISEYSVMEVEKLEGMTEEDTIKRLESQAELIKELSIPIQAKYMSLEDLIQKDLDKKEEEEENKVNPGAPKFDEIAKEDLESAKSGEGSEDIGGSEENIDFSKFQSQE